MKRSKLYLLLAVVFIVGSALAQNQPECRVYISTNFNPDCLLDEYPERLPNMLDQGSDDCMLACKGNEVVYTAVCDSGIQFTWNISGAASYYLTDQDRTANVRWGDGNTGSLSVTVITTDSNICSDEVCVLLMDPPVAECSSVPAYYIDSAGNKVIEICQGETIYFTDMSHSGRTPITGYGWNSCFGDASTQNYTLTPASGGKYPLHHYVWNECGCMNEEIIYLRIGQEARLELSCHGTVCENTTATYTVNSPSCSHYHWSVEGGTLVGQDSPDITVQWGSPSSGYGVISLDSYFCDGGCQSLFSERIPIIVDHAVIKGSDEACVGEIQLYELPMWGSTWYQWQVLPDSNSAVVSHEAEYQNQCMPEFKQPGTYTIRAVYACVFLECGPFTTQKTVIVKDTMSVRSTDSVLCKGDTGRYTTWHGNSVTWQVYRQNTQNSSLLHTSAGISLDYSFLTPGSYRVVASNPGYCRDAEFHVTVLDNPPAVTAVQGPDEACPNSSILLSATPTAPNYYLQWVPLCPTATPTSVEGDEVTVNFGAEVCGVAVYQVDDEYGCRSEAYVHTVDTFRLAPHGLPDLSHACAGSTVTFSVPAQPEQVTYEWTLSPANAATVIGDHLSPTVQILTNRLNGFTSPTMVYVTLKRTWCSNLEVYETVRISVENVEAPSVVYEDTVCVNTQDHFTATTGTLDNRHYTWIFDSSAVVPRIRGTDYKFSIPGAHTFTLNYQPDSHCDAATVSGQVVVVDRPSSEITFANDSLYVAVQPDVSYAWEFDGNPIPNVLGPVCAVTDTGTYTCTVTSNLPPYCSSHSDYSNTIPDPDPCLLFPLISSFVDCTEAMIIAQNPTNSEIRWSSPCDPSYGADTTTAIFSDPGIYTILAQTEGSGQCYIGLVDVIIDCVPVLTVFYDCNGHLIVKDSSRYRFGFTMPTRTITIEGTGLTATLTGTDRIVAIPIDTLSPGEYTVTMDMGMTIPCSATAVFSYAGNPSVSGIGIRRKMCAGTPFLFTASTTGDIVRYRWNFGDNSYNFGDSIFHTYQGNQNERIVTLIVTDSWGCTASDTAHVKVGGGILNGHLNKEGSAVCPGEFRRITYTEFSPYNAYYWNYDIIPSHSNQYNTTATGDYSVMVETDVWGCRAESRCNVGFLNAPVARINGSTEYCPGEPVRLKGNTGNTNRYKWVISGPENHVFTTPNIKFKPSTSGNYSVSLRVTSPDGCVDTASYSFVVHPKPVTPTIKLSGCIHQEPVIATCTSGQNLLWSNGGYGREKGYYEDGYLSAYYIDAITGCPSDRVYAYIEPAPNYDALLTGCYMICPDSFIYKLPVFGFYPYHSQQMLWHWYYDGQGEIDYGTNLDPMLPLIGYGTYWMETEYSTNCFYKSPDLVIEQEDLCPCEKIELTIEDIQCYVEECRMYIHLSFDIANYGSNPVTFDDIQVFMDNNILNVTGLPMYLPSYGSDFLELDVEISDLISSLLEFVLIDSQTGCEKRYTQCLDFYQEAYDCFETDCNPDYVSLDFYPDFILSHQTAYFHFYAHIPAATDVVSVWSTPSQVISFISYPPDNLDGLLMLDYGRLMQMAMYGEYVCINMIVCVDGGRLCRTQYCILASDLLDDIPEVFRHLSDSSMADNDTTRSLRFGAVEGQSSVKPYLVPNPARNEVTVMGIPPGEVAEIMVLTMQGGQVAIYRNDCRFDVSRLAKASYIVRVITNDRKVHYLKLVRQ